MEAIVPEGYELVVKEQRTKKYLASFPPTRFEALQKRAQAHNVSVNEFLNQIVWKELQDLDKKAPLE